MADKKLPKGAKSLSDVARMRGKGGTLLRAYRAYSGAGLNPLSGFPPPTVEKHEKAFQKASVSASKSGLDPSEVLEMTQRQTGTTELAVRSPVTKSTRRLLVHPRLERHTPEAVLLRGDAPSPEALKEALRKRTSDLARYLREGAVKRHWAGGKVVQTMAKVGKVGKLLGVAGLPFQYIEFREAMKQPKLHEIERQASARRM